MKLKKGETELEGSQEEIHDIFKDTGFNAGELFKAEKPPDFHWWKVAVPTALAVITAIVLTVVEPTSKLFVPICLVQLSFLVLAVCSVHLKFKNAFVTWTVIVSGFFLFALSTKAMSIVEAVQYMKDLKSQQKEQGKPQ